MCGQEYQLKYILGIIKPKGFCGVFCISGYQLYTKNFNFFLKKHVKRFGSYDEMVYFCTRFRGDVDTLI
jgi:hypothetical protein